MIEPIAQLARIRQIEPPYTFEDLEAIAVAVKEEEARVLSAKTILAYVAVEHDRIHRNDPEPPRAARWLAHLWGQSTTHGINVLAQMYEIFTVADITPDAPLSLYKAVMETDDPRYALRLATDYEFRRQELGEEYAKTDRRGIWSSAQLRRHYDIQKGRHYASNKIEATVRITTWDSATGGLAAFGFPVSGDKPDWALVTVRERLEKEEME